MNEMQFSHEANEMHAGAAEFNAQREALAELAAREEMDKREVAEAMAEARGNDGVRPFMD